MNGVYDFAEKKCAVCGKAICFLDTDRWAYKVTVGSKNNPDKTYYCCSWSCLRKMPEKPKKGRKGNDDIVIPLIREGKTNDEIRKATGLSSTTIRYWRQRYTG